MAERVDHRTLEAQRREAAAAGDFAKAAELDREPEPKVGPRGVGAGARRHRDRPRRHAARGAGAERGAARRSTSRSRSTARRPGAASSSCGSRPGDALRGVRRVGRGDRGARDRPSPAARWWRPGSAPRRSACCRSGTRSSRRKRPSTVTAPAIAARGMRGSSSGWTRSDTRARDSAHRAGWTPRPRSRSGRARPVDAYVANVPRTPRPGGVGEIEAHGRGRPGDPGKRRRSVPEIGPRRRRRSPPSSATTPNPRRR